MPYNLKTIDKADEDPVNCMTCRYGQNGYCALSKSEDECGEESLYPYWENARLKPRKEKK